MQNVLTSLQMCLRRAIAESLPEAFALLMPFSKNGKVAVASSDALISNLPTPPEQFNLVNVVRLFGP